MVTKAKLTTWDPAEYLENEQDTALYLEAAFAENDPALISAALGDIARARGMSDIARRTGLSRESLYRALFASGNPEFSTVLKVMNCLGLSLHVSS